MMKLDYTQGIELLDGAHSIAICGHVNPDGDCLGSVLALTLGLRSLGYEVTPLLATREQPKLYDFLECYADFVPACEYHARPDVFILVDVPSVSRTVAEPVSTSTSSGASKPTRAALMSSMAW